jgi:hypothetical protein
MTTKISTQIIDEGEVIDVELNTDFLNFYKKETGHSRITKRGVTRFLQSLINSYRRKFTEYYP